MPGTPRRGTGSVLGTEKYAVELQSPDIAFTVYVAPAPPPADNPFAFVPANSVNYQAIDDAKNRLQGEYRYPNTITLQTERDVFENGPTYHELVYRAKLELPGSDATTTKTLVARVYVVNDQTYTLTVLGPRVKADGTDVVKFFNSFRITAPANPKPVPPPGRQPPASPAELNGLLAYWSFDNVQGDRALDESGNALTGTLHGATIINDGARGQALHCNGPRSYFDFSDANNLNFRAGDDFTFCGWVRTRQLNGVVVSNRQDGNAAPDLGVKIDGGALSADVRQDGHAFVAAINLRGPAVNDGAWHHFALTRRCVGGNFGAVVLYVDGVRSGDQVNVFAGGAVTTDLRALGAELYWQRHGFPGGNASFIGDVDEFAVFNRVLDEGEIRRLAGVAGP